MKLFNVAAIALAFGIGGAAHGATITLEKFTISGWESASSGGVFEDFENATDANRTFAGPPVRSSGGNEYGELDASGYFSPNVGIFQTLGGIGTGTTCTDLLDRGSAGCTQIALQYDPGINGQGNVLPETGFWSVNSADTYGISWQARRGDGGMFQRVAFALTDPADTGDKRLEISVGGSSKTWEDLEDGETWLAVITLDAPTDAATIDIRTSLRDGVTLDGAAIAPVPLPATVLMLLGALGMMFAFRRRRIA